MTRRLDAHGGRGAPAGGPRPDHPDTLSSRNKLAKAYLASGRTAEAIKLHEATLKARESKFGPDHPDTLESRSNLAAAYLAAGRTAEAIGWTRRRSRRGGDARPDHPDTLTSRNNLAQAYLDDGRTAHAIEMQKATLEMQESRLGPNHPDAHESKQPRLGL